MVRVATGVAGWVGLVDGVGLGLGFGATTVAAGGATSGAAPPPKRQPSTDPGAGT